MELTEEQRKVIRQALHRANSCLNADSDRMINASIWDDDDNAAHDETHEMIQSALDIVGNSSIA